MPDDDFEMGAFASHLPVLRALRPRPKRVLEFGAGDWSTGAFLEMKTVTRLVSVETDPGWRERVSAEFSEHVGNGRWELLDGKEIPDLEEFDLIFIDDGLIPSHRIETIEYVLSRKHPRVVIHDADHKPYCDSIAALTDDFKIEDGYSPHTAVVEGNR